MLYLGLAVIAAALVMMPFLYYAKLVFAVLSVRNNLIIFTVLTILFWWFFWVSKFSLTAYPAFGAIGGIVATGMSLSGVAGYWAARDYAHRSKLFTPRVMFLCVALPLLMVGWSLLNTPIFRSGSYAALIGEVPVREWTQDVQPKDPTHMRLGTLENAWYQAGKVLSTAGSIGSQFVVNHDYITLQWLDGELQYIVPLDFRGFRTWTNNKEVPAYIKVHGEDPLRQAELVTLPAGRGLRYTPDAFFGNNLTRHLRYNGYLNYVIEGFRFEIDDEGEPWWVVQLTKPSIGWSGKKFVGYVLVDPSTGVVSELQDAADAPEWIDRTFPSNLVSERLDWWGKYRSGFINSIWGRKDVTHPENPSLVQASSGRPVWVTAVTSARNQSMVAAVYTDARTGESVQYNTPGGANDQAVLQAVNLNSQVQYLHLHGADPQLYNINGHMAAVVPLLNDAHAFQRVAVVDVMNVQQVVVGDNAVEAVRKFEAEMSRAGRVAAIDNTATESVVYGSVCRAGQEVQSNASALYYIHLCGSTNLFTGTSSDFLSLAVTEKGDSVRISYYASGAAAMAIRDFENYSVSIINSSPGSRAAQGAAEQRLREERSRSDSATIVERMRQMSPDELRRLDSLRRTSPR